MASLLPLRKWYWLHKWSSLICTLFLLVVCVTGLPLIFIDEISEHWRADPPPFALSADTAAANLDALVLAAVGPQGAFPGATVRWLSIEEDRPEIWFGLAPSYAAERRLDHIVRFDSRNGKLIRALKSGEHTSPLWLGLMFKLHTDWFAGLSGELFLAAMALLFLLATLSGVVLYRPYMKKLRFGTLRSDRSARLKWLDLHNLLGISVVVWLLVMTATGIANQLSTPLYDVWRRSALDGLISGYQHASLKHGEAVLTSGLSSVQAVHDRVLAALPGKTIRSIRFPDGLQGSPYHYLVWTKGATPMTSRILEPVLVDAHNGRLTAILPLPWYLAALQTSRPLHFGDYAGLPLKILWVLLDLITIMILISGLVLWRHRRIGIEELQVRAVKQQTSAAP